jgi:tetratricopeptide repeat protein 30
MIDRGVRQHPELGVGSKTDGLDVRSVGNSQALKETALVEAFNLRAAIEFQTGHLDAAREALTDMPPRSEEELDHVTQPPFPPETFGNLLLLYIRHQYYDLAADVMADNAHLHQTCLSQSECALA